MTYDSYTRHNNLYLANKGRMECDKLPPGSYQLFYNNDMDQLFFRKMEIHHDKIIDLPSKEYELVIKQLEHFMKPETKKAFKDNGFLYKRSFLMHGLHGTGKTILADRISNFIMKKGGIVLFNPSPGVLDKAFDALSGTQPEATIAVVFEELDQLIKRHEDDLLHLLDGEVQRENVVYLATTNYIDKIPARILRPGRFSTVVNVKFPTAKVRSKFLSIKLGKPMSNALVKEWTKKTNGLSIDEVKETVLAVNCLGETLDDIVERIRKTKELTLNDPIYDSNVDEYTYYKGYIDRNQTTELNRIINSGEVKLNG